jgi:hypothetical protein
MTSKRDLKKRIRERAARTGERYTTARQHMVGKQVRGRVPCIELDDLTEEAAQAGIRCAVRIHRELARRIDCSALLVRIRDALRALEQDPSTEALRAVMLRGEEPVVDGARPPPEHAAREQAIIVADAMRLARGGGVADRPRFPTTRTVTFLARARAGIGGVSEGGTMLSLPATGKRGLEMIVCALWDTSAARHAPLLRSRMPSAVLMTPDDFLFIVDDRGKPGASSGDSPPRDRSRSG